MKQSGKKKIRKGMWITVSIIIVLILGVWIFLNQPRFGKTPSGARMERVKNSPNYRDGKFRNQTPTQQITSDKGFFGSVLDFIFKKKDGLKPEEAIPVIKTDLFSLERDKDIFVWFGHSSYFIQLDGKRILVDPVFSKAGSPVSFVNTAFKGTNQYKPEDIPDIDYLIISHDHWDHLDYSTIKKLKPRIGNVICGLGVGEHFEYWGFDIAKIIEMDWNENRLLESGFEVFCLPARHFSGRGLSPNQSLWVSYLVKTPTFKLYIGGDSGYDDHFKKIEEQFGSMDLAILEDGQYDMNWRYIHSLPDQVIQAAKDLQTKAMIPVHNSRFALGNHRWDEPLRKVTALHDPKDFALFTPRIGQVVSLRDTTQVFDHWWEGIK